ncbi:hemolysin D [bacterium (Candidatus Blackallbacteria) CG17_big_fil_post_rev_8_21_14_2_50_48_46]|uniref:Hemolysin D n=1 Tax=bacterium (Candidatus Blackallbacteria) CG17_big_fil_post_rev_8_21_14_2_50_48_46 TaxID=2014261 RepID=A0A2M7G8Z8_9BACT|nr:MAG: hemolysin D [bacterium (Candidatus Blackallbacteria) CG18_big_fil_WC_8_21_14_2_50_49_26]PIW18592.1 MAG: hemolysin D [bacterium (Candidatus Blackallbacteria) CG17_big_fil_post_rev_8_21_14_2_50_48_46]PIW46422.1 MAG: hemolysin D [bacterium (Candidatus Blackallbacteria) CG13_big_fil_rev_8_21_14_2_50_49_14]
MNISLSSPQAPWLKQGINANQFEEIANITVAFLGLFLSLIGFAVLMAFSTMTRHWQPIVASSVYGTTLILLFAASILYHGSLATDMVHKKAFQIIDHCAIYLLIAGSFTPMGLVVLKDHPSGLPMLGLLWLIAGLGCLHKIFMPMGNNLLSTLAYVGMGWSITLVFAPLQAGLQSGGIQLIVAGGIFYTLGSVFYLYDHKFRMAHALWHGFVLAGSLSHYLAILLFVVMPGARLIG